MIEIRNITKTYPEQQQPALVDVSFSIATGEFFGLLGPNGAGKTTMIKILSTLLIPERGEILIDGARLSRANRQVKRQLAMITQEFSLRSNMTPPQIMELHGRLYRMPLAEIRSRSRELLEFCGLTEHAGKICRHLSGGMKRKLMLCRGLLTNPRILILDEPTVGLDPIARRQMWDLLKQLNEKGISILLTTHYIDEAQYLCERIALIDQGRTGRIDSPEALIRELGAVTVEEFDGNQTVSHFFQEHSEALSYAAGLERAFMIRNTTLEDVFVALLGKKLEVN